MKNRAAQDMIQGEKRWERNKANRESAGPLSILRGTGAGRGGGRQRVVWRLGCHLRRCRKNSKNEGKKKQEGKGLASPAAIPSRAQT